MDEVFIKMCAVAQDIQGQFKNEIGDLVFSPLQQIHHLGQIPAILMVGKDKFPFNHGDIWLPRQDQLQKMLKEKPFDALADIWRLFFLDESGADHAGDNPVYGYLFNTWEQLWLGVVMWKKYHKLWDKKKGAWVKVKAK